MLIDKRALREAGKGHAWLGEQFVNPEKRRISTLLLRRGPSCRARKSRHMEGR